MKKVLFSIIVIGSFTNCFADVHKFKGSDGSALLTNRQPVVRVGVESTKATIQDLQPSTKFQSNTDVEYSYEGTKKIVPITETVKVGTRDLYRKGLCKINNSIVPCYNYEKTLPATSYQIESSKSVTVNPKTVLDQRLNNTVE